MKVPKQRGYFLIVAGLVVAVAVSAGLALTTLLANSHGWERGPSAPPQTLHSPLFPAVLDEAIQGLSTPPPQPAGEQSRDLRTVTPATQAADYNSQRDQRIYAEQNELTSALFRPGRPASSPLYARALATAILEMQGMNRTLSLGASPNRVLPPAMIASPAGPPPGDEEPPPTYDKTSTCQGGASCIAITCSGAGTTCNGVSTCDESYTCGGYPTCDGSYSCSGSATCNGAATCVHLTCNGGATCNGTTPTCTGGHTCGGYPTCDGSMTCNESQTCMTGASTCTGGSTCMRITCGGRSQTCNGTSPTCTGQYSCGGWPTCNGTGTCGGYATCNGTPTCIAQTCRGGATCSDTPTCTRTPSCGGWSTCDGSTTCAGNGAQTCNGAATCAGGASCVEITCRSGGSTCVSGSGSTCNGDQTPTCGGQPSCGGTQTCSGGETPTCSNSPTCVTQTCRNGPTCDRTSTCDGASTCGGCPSCEGTPTCDEESPECVDNPTCDANCAGGIEGWVYDDFTHKPIHMALVNAALMGSSDATMGGPSGAALTDGEGWYSIDELQPGSYEVDARAVYPDYDEYDPQSTSTSVSGGAWTQVNFLLHKHHGTFYGTVTDDYTGQPIQGGATITIRGEFYPYPFYYPQTNGEGDYEGEVYAATPPDFYTMWASYNSDGYEDSSEQQHWVAPDEDKMVSFELHDIAPPESEVDALPEFTYQVPFLVSWSGEDQPIPDGSGIASYDVQYAVDDGPWTDWFGYTQTMATEGMFNCVPGHTYYFRCCARDYNNNVEDYPEGYFGDTYTTVIAPELTILDSGDYIVPGSPLNAVDFEVGTCGASAVDFQVLDASEYVVRSEVIYWDPEHHEIPIPAGQYRYYWDGYDAWWNGFYYLRNPLTEYWSPYTIRMSALLGSVSSAWSVQGDRLVEEWELGIEIGDAPTEDGGMSEIVSGVDEDTIIPENLRIRVSSGGPFVDVGPADITHDVEDPAGEPGNDWDAIVWLGWGPLNYYLFYTTPSSPVDIQYVIRLDEIGDMVSDCVLNPWDMDPDDEDFDTIGTLTFGMDTEGLRDFYQEYEPEPDE